MRHFIKQLSKAAAAGMLLASAVSALPAYAAGPAITAVTPATATAGTPVTFSATVSSANGIQYCHLYVDLEDVGNMTVAGNVASMAYTFASGGSRVAFVFCKDNAGGLGAGPNTAIWVNGAIQNQPPLSSPPPPSAPPSPPVPSAPQGPAAGSLIKLECPAGATADHPCKAVYYVGKDGKRHAFPNGKMYFSWYADFNSVTTVTSEVMGSFSLGKNVTYRPGSKLVKFTTLNNVYAVAKGGKLQWVTTEAVAIGLYGTGWNKKVDDIADTFYGNYTVGSDISAAVQFDVQAQLAAASTIDDTL